MTPAERKRAAELQGSARHVMTLACELRDDLDNFHKHLNKATERQRYEWLIIALAAIDINQTMSQLLRWVSDIEQDAA